MTLLADEVEGLTYQEDETFYTITRENARQRVIDMLSAAPEGDDDTAVDARILEMERQRDRAIAGAVEMDVGETFSAAELKR